MRDRDERYFYICDDCQQGVRLQAHSVITDDMQHRQYCDPCYRQRARIGAEFDPRPLSAIPRQTAHQGAA